MRRLIELTTLALCLLATGASAAEVETTPNLLALYQAALQTNPVLKSREFGVDRARAQEDQARSRLLPQVSASGNYSWNDYYDRQSRDQRYGAQRGSIQARQALLDLASYFRLQGAKFTVLQSERDLDAIRIGLAGEVLDRYFLVLQGADEISHLLAEKEATATQLKRLRAMRERQLVKITDLYEVEAYYEGLLTKEIEARNAEAVARERLRETTGVSVRRLAPMARQEFPPLRGSEDDWVSEAARRNPNLAALQHSIDGARELIASARSEHAPQVALTLGQTYSEQGFDNRLQPPYRIGSLGVQVTIPIYEGGRVQGSVDEAVARHEIARQQYEQARREIERETRTAYLNATAGQARIGSTGREVQALEKTVDSQQRSYELGVATIVDLLTARQRLIKARSEQSKARYDFVRDLTSLRIRAGSLSAEDLDEVNRWLIEPATPLRRTTFASRGISTR